MINCFADVCLAYFMRCSLTERQHDVFFDYCADVCVARCVADLYAYPEMQYSVQVDDRADVCVADVIEM